MKGHGNHLAGGKISSSHTTVIDAAIELVKTADKLEEVSKIVLGMITPGLGVGRHVIKFLPIMRGLKVVVRGTNSKQELFIYTSNPVRTESALREMFERV